MVTITLSTLEKKLLLEALYSLENPDPDKGFSEPAMETLIGIRMKVEGAADFQIPISTPPGAIIPEAHDFRNYE